MMEIIPRLYEQEIPPHVFNDTPLAKHDIEFTGVDVFWSHQETEKTIIMLVSMVGLKQFCEMFPPQSRNELASILLLSPK